MGNSRITRHEVTRSGSQPSLERAYFLTTQPGWAFATRRELRGIGVAGRVAFHHRDSSLFTPAAAGLESARLLTPAGVHGCLAEFAPSGRLDAAGELARWLDSARLKALILQWLPLAEKTASRRFSVTTELYGRTSMPRGELDRAVTSAAAAAFPRWRLSQREGVRLLCKADAEKAVLGLQLYSNLGGEQDGLPGTLRSHLACGLLTIAGVGSGDTVFDPFMGTGTILEMAADRYGAGPGIGLEVDADAYRVARARLAGRSVTPLNAPFERFDYASLPSLSRLVSNVPSGVRFAQVRTAALQRLIRRRELSGSPVALLLSRDQADGMAARSGMRRKNVLVLGQPASILYGRASSQRGAD